MEKLKQELKFHLGLHVLIAIFVTIASYIYLPFDNVKGNFTYIIHFLLLHFSLFGYIYLLSLFKKVFFIVFPILFFIVTSFSFWVYTQDLTIGTGMIQAILETNIDVAVDILNFYFIAFVLVSLSAILLFLKFNKRKQISSIKSPLFYLSFFGILTFFVVENYKFDAFKKRLPYNIYFGSLEYFKKPKTELKKVTGNVFTKEKDLEIILIMGESVRADHLSLNGYHRNTTPLLAEQKNLISFKNVFTPFTFTAQSVPQILTNQSIKNHLRETKFTSIFSVLNKASFNSKWIGNQSLEKSYKDIIYSNSSKLIIDEFHTFSSLQKKKDLELLNYFKQDSLQKNSITTFHMIGSHWYYNSRIDSNFIKFKPITTTKFLGSLEKQQLINSYDNTIVYLDFFANTLIEKLKKSDKKTILIYISDHGETLGEDGMWLHAQEHEASKNPAMFVWFSEKFAKNYPKKIKKLIKRKNDSISTDFLFHSILDISNIENFNYNKDKSIFN